MGRSEVSKGALEPLNFSSKNVGLCDLAVPQVFIGRVLRLWWYDTHSAKHVGLYRG